jgi:hypothetical protein
MHFLGVIVMIQIEIFEGDILTVKTKLNDWLENQQMKREYYFKLIGIDTIFTDGFKQGYHGVKILSTVTYDLKNKQEYTSYYRK